MAGDCGRQMPYVNMRRHRASQTVFMWASKHSHHTPDVTSLSSSATFQTQQESSLITANPRDAPQSVAQFI